MVPVPVDSNRELEFIRMPARPPDAADTEMLPFPEDVTIPVSIYRPTLDPAAAVVELIVIDPSPDNVMVPCPIVVACPVDEFAVIKTSPSADAKWL